MSWGRSAEGRSTQLGTWADVSPLSLSLGTRRVCVFVSALIVVPAISLSAMGEDVAAVLPAYAIALALLVIAVCPTTPLASERAAPRRARVRVLRVRHRAQRRGDRRSGARRVGGCARNDRARRDVVVRHSFGGWSRSSRDADTRTRDGYASLLSREDAGPRFDADLARSRRNGSQLSLIVLEGDSPGVDVPAREFRLAVDQLPRGVLDEARARIHACARIRPARGSRS